MSAGSEFHANGHPLKIAELSIFTTLQLLAMEPRRAEEIVLNRVKSRPPGDRADRWRSGRRRRVHVGCRGDKVCHWSSRSKLRTAGWRHSTGRHRALQAVFATAKTTNSIRVITLQSEKNSPTFPDDIAGNMSRTNAHLFIQILLEHHI